MCASLGPVHSFNTRITLSRKQGEHYGRGGEERRDGAAREGELGARLLLGQSGQAIVFKLGVEMHLVELLALEAS